MSPSIREIFEFWTEEHWSTEQPMLDFHSLVKHPDELLMSCQQLVHTGSKTESDWARRVFSTSLKPSWEDAVTLWLAVRRTTQSVFSPERQVLRIYCNQARSRQTLIFSSIQRQQRPDVGTFFYLEYTKFITDTFHCQLLMFSVT